jgi:putative heme-binding domain-containing protein
MPNQIPVFVSSCLRGSLFCLAIFLATPAIAQESEADPARDALIVETLLRLDSFDLEAKPKTKAAVLRFLAMNRGSERFFQLIEKFKIKDAAGDLLELAIAQPSETVGVEAAELLLKLDAQQAMDETLTGEDHARAAALVTALGNVGGQAVNDHLMPLVTAEKQPLAVRAAAAQAIGKTKSGADYLLSLAKEKQLPADLNFTAANILFASPDPAVRESAARYLELPVTAGATPLPPLPELIKMPGDAARGKQLFMTAATCNKCHVVNGEGKDVGPNLSEIGSKLAKDACLISILDPSAGISHNFETYLAVTADGKVISGLLVSKTDSEVVLKDANAIVHTLAVSDLDEFAKLPTSLMPADLQKTMSAQDLVDVVEYLLTLKKK